MAEHRYPTVEETRAMLRAPFRTGTAAKGYSGLEIGQEILFRPYPNDPSYVEIHDQTVHIPVGRYRRMSQRSLLVVTGGAVAGAGFYQALFVARGTDRIFPLVFAVLYALIAVLLARREDQRRQLEDRIHALPDPDGRPYLREHFLRHTNWLALAIRGSDRSGRK